MSETSIDLIFGDKDEMICDENTATIVKKVTFNDDKMEEERVLDNGDLECKLRNFEIVCGSCATKHQMIFAARASEFLSVSTMKSFCLKCNYCIELQFNK